MQTLKWGILSTAKIARTVMIPAMRTAAHAVPVAIASEHGKAVEVAREFGIPRAHDSFQALLEDPEVEAVYIPLPNSLHAEWTIAAARHGKHVLCEKPAALNLDEARRMQQECNAYGVCLMEGYMYRQHPQHQRIRALLEEGVIGELRHVRGHFSFPLDLSAPSIKLDRQLGGGSLNDVGCYPLDVIRRLLGMPEKVTVVGELDPYHDVDLTVSGILRFAEGRLAEFTSSFRQTLTHRYELIGTRGRITVVRAFRPDKHDGEGLIMIHDGQGKPRSERLSADQYPAQLDHFAAWVQGDNRHAADTGEVLAQASLIDACQRSMRSGRTEVPETP
ncbi:Gfo/Idh/MocA family oxidoreductase [Halomonas sp. EGI 63088]|uniref:Gfo/Idh/MocA family oxidoreductase n=1 Tax=Halomonas flagellata TaxID=2920385 RepID=A0ABS9RZS4_9GAMM|nr:Gfo/Idh/MocA family oxidoreductase [Halomonas flagellata]MCH4565319.1 Gfo/Idh/MocA family oxidoreductase [Halomonas flagellata]